MKRWWLVLLSTVLVALFAASAFAVDVKFSGSYYAAGMYQDKAFLIKGGEGGPSTAFYYQRLRVRTDFVVAPGLSVVTRFDAMERAWGAARSAPDNLVDRQSAGTKAENQNIAFDWAFVEYTSPIGYFNFGYQDDGGWGTVFSDSTVPQGLFTWAVMNSGFTAFLQVVKVTEKSRMATNAATAFATDNDTDKYQVGAFYEWKTGQAGLLAVYYRSAANRALISPGPIPPAGTDIGSLGKIFVLQPYVIAKFGPLKVQAELDYAWGDIKYDFLTGQDMRVDNLAGWIDATVDIKQFYFGGTFAYVAGNDWSNPNVIKGGFLTGGMDWNPTLILFNNERTYWAGAIQGNWGSTTSNNAVAAAFGIDDTGMYNAWFFQGRAGIRPIDKLDILASVSYAKATSKTWEGNLVGLPDFVSDEYGWEVDVAATYKITNNLSYMIGGGYLFTGNYFKGFDPMGNAEVSNEYLLINKLTLTF